MENQQQTYTNKYAKTAAGGPIKWLLQQTLVGCAIHWMFQGLLYADPTERWFKLALDAVLTLAFWLILAPWLSSLTVWIAAFFCAHTINFLFNAQLWVLLKHYGLVRNSY